MTSLYKWKNIRLGSCHVVSPPSSSTLHLLTAAHGVFRSTFGAHCGRCRSGAAGHCHHLTHCAGHYLETGTYFHPFTHWLTYLLTHFTHAVIPVVVCNPLRPFINICELCLYITREELSLHHVLYRNHVMRSDGVSSSLSVPTVTSTSMSIPCSFPMTPAGSSPGTGLFLVSQPYVILSRGFSVFVLWCCCGLW